MRLQNIIKPHSFSAHNYIWNKKYHKNKTLETLRNATCSSNYRYILFQHGIKSYLANKPRILPSGDPRERRSRLLGEGGRNLS